MTCVWYGLVADWLGSRSCDQQVAGSNPGRRTVECNPEQVAFISVTKQCNLAAGEVTAGVANGSLPPGFTASVTCGLTAEDWDQLPNPTLVSSMGLPYLLPVSEHHYDSSYQISR